MAKKKKGQKKDVNKVRKIPVKKDNPFDLHYNRKKMTVLGQDSKNDIGRPGISRAKAQLKRKNTLLQEYLSRNKSNQFIDKRIGQFNSNMTDEARAMARFVANRTKNKSKFILDDDDEEEDDNILTHKGQSINQIEKFEQAKSDDDDSDDEDNGKLGANFVEEAHFGGGLLSSKSTENGSKSYSEVINELIRESKKRKLEKQVTKGQVEAMVEKLDSEWHDLIPLMKTKKSKKDMSEEEKKKRNELDECDMWVNNLAFEPRLPASERLKTDEEVAIKNKEKLDRLEKERTEKMSGVVKNAKKHISADDLDDGFVFENEQETTLSYNEKGQPNVVIEGKILKGNDSENESDEESGEDVETESEDNYSDLEEDEESSQDENEDKDSKLKRQTKEEIFSPSSNIKNEKNEIELKRKAEAELPETFTIPSCYDDFENLLSEKSPQEIQVILERTIKSNHPSLSVDNKKNLEHLFVFILQYIKDMPDNLQIGSCFKMLPILAPKLYDIAKLNAEDTSKATQGLLKELHDDYRKKRKKYPNPGVLLFIKLIGCLYPTSNYRHPIITPCSIFIAQMLRTCLVKSKMDIVYGLMLTTLVLEFSALSKRYLPESVSFLSGILHMCIPKTEPLKVVPPFTSKSTLLVLDNNRKDLENVGKLKYDDLVHGNITDNFKIKALRMTLKLLSDLKGNLASIPSSVEIFEPALRYLEAIPSTNYPKEVRVELKNMIVELVIQKETRKLIYLVQQGNKPKALRLYTPKIEKVYDNKKNNAGKSQKKIEREKLVAKFRKERKSALREIRKDKDFLVRQKVKERIESANERIQKVKKIFAEAAVQQADLKKFSKLKK